VIQIYACGFTGVEEPFTSSRATVQIRQCDTAYARRRLTLLRHVAASRLIRRREAQRSTALESNARRVEPSSMQPGVAKEAALARIFSTENVWLISRMRRTLRQRRHSKQPVPMHIASADDPVVDDDVNSQGSQPLGALNDADDAFLLDDAARRSTARSPAGGSWLARDRSATGVGRDVPRHAPSAASRH
jgi:hypothetical protein